MSRPRRNIDRTAVLLLELLAVMSCLLWGLDQVQAATAVNQDDPAEFVWPISGTDSPDLPNSSTYGPRLRYGCDYCYDYHQGLDIPADVGTTIHAVSTGTVRIAGSHPKYSDGVVQIDHGNDLYSNYLHITSSLVTTGQLVYMGDPIALSGVGSSGFPHLHFELREGSLFRRDTINPFHYLPYADSVTHTVEITQVHADHSVSVQVTAPATELDFVAISVTVRQSDTKALLDHRLLDYEARNRFYNGQPSVLDTADLDKVLVSPHIFSSSSETYTVDFSFLHLRGIGEVEIEACGFDVQDNAVCVVQYGYFDTPMLITPTLHIETTPTPLLSWPDDNPTCVTDIYRHTDFYGGFPLWEADHPQVFADISADVADLNGNHAYYLSVDCYGEVAVSNTAAAFTFSLVASQE